MRKFSLFILAWFILSMPIYAQGLGKRFIYRPQGRRDIMRALIDSQGRLISSLKPSIGGLKLEGIIYSPGGESFAIIDGELYKKGDSLGDFKVADIKKDRVVILDEDGKKVELILEQEVIE